MTPNPILRVLSSLLKSEVEFLLMGGQACILYGAAEFSRDINIRIRIGNDNLKRLRAALQDLDAELIYFPELSPEALERGHACHFRAQIPEAKGMRLDVMSRQRGVDDWPSLWRRRETLDVPDLGTVPVMGLEDLVQAKKTQRDKDWPMIRRLIEADIQAHAPPDREEKTRFWLRECRTPEILVDLVEVHEEQDRRLVPVRPALEAALSGNLEALSDALRSEEDEETRRAPRSSNRDRDRHEFPVGGPQVC